MIIEKKNKPVIPGFGLSMGITISILSLVVLTPPGKPGGLHSEAEFLKILSKPSQGPECWYPFIPVLYVLFAAAVINGIMGTVLAWVLVKYDFSGQETYGWDDRTSLCSSHSGSRYCTDIPDLRFGNCRQSFLQDSVSRSHTQE